MPSNLLFENGNKILLEDNNGTILLEEKILNINKAKYSTYCNLPDQLIPETLAIYFKNVLGNSNKFVNIFGINIYPYARDDNPTVALPSINFYFLGSRKTGDMGYLNGICRAEFNLPVIANREQLTEASMAIYNMFTFLIMTKDFLNYFSDAIPGLREFNWNTETNMRDMYATKNRTTYTFYIDLDYMVDLTAYYFYLNKHGLNVADPCDQAEIITSYILDVNSVIN